MYVWEKIRELKIVEKYKVRACKNLDELENICEKRVN